MWTVRKEIGWTSESTSETRSLESLIIAKEKKTRTGIARSKSAADGPMAVHNSSTAMQIQATNALPVRSSRTF